MIYIRIWGGLGNQMFQFAAAWSLAHAKKTTVGICLDKINETRIEAGFTKRAFELDHVFELTNYTLIDSRRFDYIIKPNRGLIDKLRNRLYRTSFFFEPSLNYQPAFEKLTREAYLEGYFQSEKYFQSAGEMLLKNFRFKNKPSVKTTELLERVNGKQTVAIHVRRGDFTLASNLNVHGLCSIDYYQRAVETFRTFSDVVFIVVSDDPEWVKANLLLHQPVVYVDWNKESDSWQDMLILSKCRHAIIANSSFSWWGAMLIKNSQKQVIAPARWYASDAKEQQTLDLIPSSWIRI